MKIKMLTTADGSPDGIQVVTYENGVEYDVPDELGDILVREQFAQAADTPAKAKHPRRSKDHGAQPENKQD